MLNKTVLIGLMSFVLLTTAFFIGSQTLLAAPAPSASGYKVIKTVPLGGEGGWDYVYVDSGARRVYISRGTHTVVMDADTYAVVGDIPDTQGVHGIAIANDLGRGFTSNGRIFVNNEDTSELIQIDSQKIAEVHRWPLAPCKSPSGLSMDVKNRRLYAVCDDKVSVIVNADTGKVVATPEIGNGPDASAFDPGTNDFFASCGEGVLTVIHEDSPDKYTVVENVPTKRSARTMGLDLKTHNIFMPAADFDPPAPGERRGKMKADSFVIVVVGK